MSELGERVVIASVSGGKDSTAMCLHLAERGIPFVPVFLDTGWENRATYDYLREVLPPIIGEITWLRPKVPLSEEREVIAERLERKLGHHSAFIRLILKKGMFPSRRLRFCTQTLKAHTIRDYLLGLDDDPINAVGIRAAESRSRAKMAEWEFIESFDCDTWRPLIDWTDQQVIDIHTRHSIPPNPNYLAGASRVGCWPCIYARKLELRHIADIDPERIQLIEELEAIVLAQRIASRERRVLDTDIKRPTFFQDRNPSKTADGSRNHATWPIKTAVEWSRTTNGRQFEMFAADRSDEGCMRWGLCDTGKAQ